jgi:hypothetical protein
VGAEGGDVLEVPDLGIAFVACGHDSTFLCTSCAGARRHLRRKGTKVQ